MTDLFTDAVSPIPALEKARRDLELAAESGIGYAEAAAKLAQLESEAIRREGR